MYTCTAMWTRLHIDLLALPPLFRHSSFGGRTSFTEHWADGCAAIWVSARGRLGGGFTS